MRIVYARQGDTVDALIWRELGATAGLVEQVLAHNRGLASLGPVLPTGTRVEIPERENAASTPILPTLQLWD